jgi:hypothetical protein
MGVLFEEIGLSLGIQFLSEWRGGLVGIVDIEANSTACKREILSQAQSSNRPDDVRAE